jgi:uncharacterized protein (DUF2062 family)
MKRSHPDWTDRFRKSLPSRSALAAHPWLQPLASRLLDPQLWRLQHEAVARGVAVGTFWTFVIPVAQIVVATAHCTWWRANIPAAAAMTMVINPLTIGFWLWLAYQTGALVLGEPLATGAPPGDGTLSWLANRVGHGHVCCGRRDRRLPGRQTDLALAHLDQKTPAPVIPCQFVIHAAAGSGGAGAMGEIIETARRASGPSGRYQVTSLMLQKVSQSPLSLTAAALADALGAAPRAAGLSSFFNSLLSCTMSRPTSLDAREKGVPLSIICATWASPWFTARATLPASA